MAEETTQSLESIIKQISSEDETYANSLTKEVSNVLGYQNFQARQGKYKDIVNIPDLQSGAGASDFTPNLHGDLTPAGVKQQVSSNLDMRLDEMAYQKSLAKKGSSAEKDATLNKVASDWYSGLLDKIEVKDDFTGVLKKMIENPLDDDGTFKTPDEMKEELAAYVEAEGFHSTEEAEKLAEEMVDKYITPDMQDKFQEIYYRKSGFTKAEISDQLLIDRALKGEMSETELELHKRINPTFAGKIESLNETPALNSDLIKIQTGNKEALSFTELQSKYPTVTKEIVKPYYSSSLLDDIRIAGEENKLGEILSENEAGEVIAKDYSLWAESPNLKRVKDMLAQEYQGVLSPVEIDSILYDYYMSVAGQYL